MDIFDTATSRHNVKAIHKNNLWNHKSLQFDFALLELEEPISLSGTSMARAACLPGPDDTDFSTRHIGSLNSGLDRNMHSPMRGFDLTLTLVRPVH